jgi:hypothetical protein
MYKHFLMHPTLKQIREKSSQEMMQTSETYFR